MSDALFCLVVADWIHGTDEAVLATAHRVRELVRIECRPTIAKIIRCGAPRVWVENYLKVLEI